jgi:hypothetical protein
MASLADYADDPAVVAYLKSLQAAQQGTANSPNLAATGAVPFDAALTARQNLARTSYQNRIAGIAAQEPMVRRRFGFTEQGQIDPSNPFGRAQLLKRSYDQSQRGTTNSLAARGQLYSGALQRQKEENQFNYQANDAALRGLYGQEMAGLSAARFAAQDQFNREMADAYWGWLQAQIEARAAEPGSTPDSSGSPVEAPPVPNSTMVTVPGHQPQPVSTYSNPQAAVQAAHAAADAGGYEAPTGARPGNSASDPAFGLAALAPYVGTPAEAWLRAQYAKQQAGAINWPGLPSLAPVGR